MREWTSTGRRIGILSSIAVFFLGLVYAITLVLGLLSLESQQEPIQDPYFSILELLIIVMAPLAVIVMVAVHAYASREVKTYSLVALIFMSILAGITCSVHFIVLTVSRQIESAGLPWLPLFLSFRWPSVIYALDILAWDLFYGLSVLFAAPIFRGDRLETSVRICMMVSGVLSIAGMIGPALGDMQLRLMIGVTGYAVLFPVVCLLLALVFRRTKPFSEGAIA